MAEIERVGEVLIVTGRNAGDELIFGPGYSGRLRNLLNDDPASPVRRGTHEFWMTITVPQLGTGLWVGEDLTITPRMFRGFVRMGEPPPIGNLDDIRGWVGVAMQEVGHHWLVPRDLAFDVEGSARNCLTSAEFVDAMNRDVPFDGPLLLGRDDTHWSIFFPGDGSPMDGTHSELVDEYRGVARRDFRPLNGPEVDPGGGLPPIRLSGGFNDLDKLIMGVVSRAEAYQDENHDIPWIEPRLMAPLAYRTGLFVALGPQDYLHFGFDRDHRTLSVTRTGRQDALFQVPLERVVGSQAGRDNEYTGTGCLLRIERRGNTLSFQCGGPDYAAGCLAWLFEKLKVIPFIPVRPARVQTLFEMALDAPANAVGVITITRTGEEHFAEGAFRDTTLEAGGLRYRLPLDPLPPLADAADLPSLSVGEWRRFQPGANASITAHDGELRVTTPRGRVAENGEYSGEPGFDHGMAGGAFVDRAPRVLARLPPGDFVFTSAARVRRTSLSPWSGARAFGTTVYGTARALPAVSTLVPDSIRLFKQAPPPGNTYRFAFIIVAAQRADVTADMIARMDRVRRYFEANCNASLAPRRFADTSLD